MLTILNRINKKAVTIAITTLSIILLLNLPILHQTIGTHTSSRFSILSSLSTDIEEQQFCTPYFIYHSITGYPTQHYIQLSCNCDIVTNYDNTIVIEYRGQQYKCIVKDGNNYNNSKKALVTFNTSNLDNVKSYYITNIKPL